MPPTKRKKQQSTKPKAKKTNQTTLNSETDANNSSGQVPPPSTIDLGTSSVLETLTAQITKAVTSSVMENLRQAGVLTLNNTASVNNNAPVHNSVNNNATVNNIASVNNTASVTQHEEQQPSGETSPTLTPMLPQSQGQASAILTLSSTSPSSSVRADGYVSSRMPLHALISQKKKENIWAGEYIDLSTLQEDDVEDITINLHTGKLSSSRPSRKKFLNIEQWTDAFNIFASVRRIRYPAEADGLAAYMNLIRRIANEKGSWYFYDTNFRKLKQSVDRAWDEIENELFFLALSRKQQPFRPARESDSASKPASRRGNYTTFRSCNKFNRGVQCHGCNYPHICSECGKSNHAQYRCWSKSQSKPQNSQTAPSSSNPQSSNSQSGSKPQPKPGKPSGSIH